MADVGDIARLADRKRFAFWTGTAPLNASSGEQNRHRLSRAGNRRVNHMIRIAAVHLFDVLPDMTPSFPRNGVSGHAGAVHAGLVSESAVGKVRIP